MKRIVIALGCVAALMGFTAAHDVMKQNGEAQVERASQYFAPSTARCHTDMECAELETPEELARHADEMQRARAELEKRYAATM